MELESYMDELIVLNADYMLTDRLCGAQVYTAAPGERIHRHDFYELYYVLEGSCTAYIQGTYEMLEPRDFYVLGESVWHQLISLTPGSQVLCVRLRREFMRQFFPFSRDGEFLGDACNVIFARLAGQDDLHQRFLDIAVEHGRIGSHEKELLSARVVLMLGYFFRYGEDGGPVQYQKRHTPTGTRLRTAEIVSYINDHYATVTRRELADVFGYDENYMSHLVQRATGLRFTQLRQTFRLEHARRLLAFSEATVEGVAHRTGFQNMTHFYRLFRQTYGISPTQYRSQPDAATEMPVRLDMEAGER